ncbi:hypothetical protein AB0M43_11040 [Longispora sp. NPDC051575]|uniref:hypothetical protein n=1 Tax=Longispora sp. NPDC051575 TaxID=3154943 RepID=UPI003434C9B2
MDNGFLILGVVGLTACVAAVAIWQLFATQRARATLAREDEYRGLAARAVLAEEANARRLDELATGLADVRTRLEKIERVLTAVE